MKKNTILILLAIAIIIVVVMAGLILRDTGRPDPKPYISSVTKFENVIDVVTDKIIGVTPRIMSANEKITVKGQEFNKNAEVNKLQTKRRNGESFTKSFNSSDITDKTKLEAMIMNHDLKCKGLTKEDYVGDLPLTMDDILTILQEGC